MTQFNNPSAGICHLRDGQFPRPGSAFLPMGVLGTQHDRRAVAEFVIPSSTAMAAVHDELGDGSAVMLGAQNAHWEESGAWTGELSVPQVADAGARIVELGHSERREYFGETDRTVNLKVKAVMRHGLL